MFHLRRYRVSRSSIGRDATLSLAANHRLCLGKNEDIRDPRLGILIRSVHGVYFFGYQQIRHRHEVRRFHWMNCTHLRHFHACLFQSDKSNETPGHSSRVHLPTLGQNGTLVLRSDSNSISKVQILPQWRDDTLLELVQDNDDIDGNVNIPSWTAEPSASDSSDTQIFGGMRLRFHKDGIETSLGRVGSLVEVNVFGSNSTTHTNDNNQTAIDGNETSNKFTWKMIINVPEKTNITCQLAGGDIFVNGKLEGDINLTTSNANIMVSKLRGHNVTLDNTARDSSKLIHHSKSTCRGIIHISKAIEARTVRINASERVRARMINGSDVRIEVKPTEPTSSHDKLDDDDENATIDIGSLYLSQGGGTHGSLECEALLIVDQEELNSSSSHVDSHGLVRVKSNHGHVIVNIKAKNIHTRTSEGKHVVALEGVNGSCDLMLEALDRTSSRENFIATRVHFDALAPESISTITSRGQLGSTSITMDRKLHADLRMLSLAKSSNGLPVELDAHSLSIDDAEEMKSLLHDLERTIRARECGRGIDHSRDVISIETNAFERNCGTECFSPTSTSGVHYVSGTIRNRSGEPDSRFDVRSGGKINIDGAASQALRGFQPKTEEPVSKDDTSDFVPPLLSVVTDGSIQLESLSWLGSIARRYGLDETARSEVGRQAGRLPRLKSDED